jgi:hypothetical protein
MKDSGGDAKPDRSSKCSATRRAQCLVSQRMLKYHRQEKADEFVKTATNKAAASEEVRRTVSVR